MVREKPYYFTVLFVLAILVFSGDMCFSQNCIQPATRKFGPYPATPGSMRTLRNPIPEVSSGPNSLLKIITLGDSVVWGDGNVEKNKFSIKIAHDLADGTGRPTEVVAYAHSGAKLANGADPSSLVPTDAGPVYQMDLNSDRPTTQEQAECASIQDPDAEIVIVDGCINEVGATNIALPTPLNWTTPADIHAATFKGCSAPMQRVLTTVKNGFPNATIILLNYYQVVTPKSTLWLDQAVNGAGLNAPHVSPAAPAQAGTPQPAADALDAERDKLLGVSGGHNKEYSAPRQLFPETVLQWSQDSLEFLNTSRDCFNWAVADVDGDDVDPLPQVSDTASCPSHKPNDPDKYKNLAPPPRVATRAVRVFLADLDDEPQFGFGAKHTHEWRLPILHHDDMFNIRQPLCKEHYSDFKRIEGCEVNAIAHPNRLGAEAYHQSIWKILRTAWASNPTP